jgi:hypothetical protein
MATFKLTLKRGQQKENVVRSNGTSISGSDAVELNVDATAMSRGELVIMLDELKQQILQKGFPQ